MIQFENLADNRETGRLGEDIACMFLEQRGYRIEERNYRRPWGEIDIIALRANIVHFVEVKALSVPGLSREIDYRPEELVDIRKLRKLSRTAALYMENKRDGREFQIDVIGILLDKKARAARCRFFEQALEGNL